jgi:hypothetical protein
VEYKSVKIMKKLLFCIALAMAAISCIPSSVIRGSGRQATGEFDITPGYTSLEVSSGITVELVRSATSTGSITADDQVIEHVSIVEDGGRVKVSYEPFITVQSKVATVVTMPLSENLSRLDVSSAAKVVSAERLRASTMEIEGSSAAGIELDIDSGSVSFDLSSAAGFSGNVVVQTLDAELNSASSCSIKGSVSYGTVNVSSAANFRGLDLVCARAVVDASSAGNVEISATEELTASASSGGSVRYRGTPSILRRDTSSGGSVREMD